MAYLMRILAGAALSAAGPGSAAIIDIAAAAPAATSFVLAAGRYELAFAGIADGGRYDAYSLWSHTHPWDDPRSMPDCWSGNSECRYGFQNSFTVTADGATTLFRLQAAAIPAVAEYYRYTTASAALAAARAGPYEQPLAFTLRSRSTVQFSVDDTSWRDNEGGVSLFVTRVPEPAAWTTMIVGFGAVGLARRRRPVSVTA